jgi:hypothetical protein
MSNLRADVHHISRMTNCAAYSILTLAAFMRSPMFLKSSSKYLRRTPPTADLSPLRRLAIDPVHVEGVAGRTGAAFRSALTTAFFAAIIGWQDDSETVGRDGSWTDGERAASEPRDCVRSTPRCRPDAEAKSGVRECTDHPGRALGMAAKRYNQLLACQPLL